MGEDSRTNQTWLKASWLCLIESLVATTSRQFDAYLLQKSQFIDLNYIFLITISLHSKVNASSNYRKHFLCLFAFIKLQITNRSKILIFNVLCSLKYELLKNFLLFWF